MSGEIKASQAQVTIAYSDMTSGQPCPKTRPGLATGRASVFGETSGTGTSSRYHLEDISCLQSAPIYLHDKLQTVSNSDSSICEGFLTTILDMEI